MNDITRNSHRKADWNLSEQAFKRFLAFLDAGDPSGGSSYLLIRRRLVDYFDRKNCAAPDDLADETLNRVARRLDEEGELKSETPAKFCYITARFVFLESLRSAESTHASFEAEELKGPIKDPRSAIEAEEAVTKEAMFDCLESCTSELPAANRDLIARYYYGTERVKIENRRDLAGELEISMNALAIRACRIREKLHACVTACLAAK